MTLTYRAMPTEIARAYQRGCADAYGNSPQRFISDGDGNPCRHCLRMIAEGDEALLIAYRPFTTIQAFAETGPVFLHARECTRGGGGRIPEILASPDYIVRGYSADERIVYGTGGVIPREDIAARADELLQRSDIAFVDIRSSRNNCYQCRIERG
jgi:hypothetical protein